MNRTLNSKIGAYRAELVGLCIAEGLLDEKEHLKALKNDEGYCNNNALYLAMLNRLAETDLNNPTNVADFLAEFWPGRCEDFDNEDYLVAAEAFAKAISQ